MSKDLSLPDLLPPLQSYLVAPTLESVDVRGTRKSTRSFSQFIWPLLLLESTIYDKAMIEYSTFSEKKTMIYDLFSGKFLNMKNNAVKELSALRFVGVRNNLCRNIVIFLVVVFPFCSETETDQPAQGKRESISSDFTFILRRLR